MSLHLLIKRTVRDYTGSKIHIFNNSSFSLEIDELGKYIPINITLKGCCDINDTLNTVWEGGLYY